MGICSEQGHTFGGGQGDGIDFRGCLNDIGKKGIHPVHLIQADSLGQQMFDILFDQVDHCFRVVAQKGRGLGFEKRDIGYSVQ